MLIVMSLIVFLNEQTNELYHINGVLLVVSMDGGTGGAGGYLPPTFTHILM